MEGTELALCEQILRNQDYIPYVERKSQLLKIDRTVESLEKEIIELAKEKKKDEETILQLTKYYLQIYDQLGIQQEQFENEKQELLQRIDQEEKKSNDFEKQYQDKCTQEKNHFERIDQLEDEIKNKDSEIQILSNTIRRVSNPQSKEDSLLLQQNNQTIEELTNDLLDQKKQNTQVKRELEEFKRHFYRQENELEKALKDFKIIQSEKNILEVKKKQLQEDLDKQHKITTEQEDKNQKQEILLGSLQKHIIELQQSQFGKYQNDNLEESTFFRTSRNQSQQFSKDLNSELPQLSHRGQTNELETIQECSMIQEMSAQHSRQVTTIPDQFVNQFDPFELQQSRISLDKSQNKPNVLEQQDNLEINQKAKSIEELNKIQVPPIVVPLPEVKEETKTQNNEQKNDMDLYRRITYPNQQNNQNIFKEIYKADFDEYSKMKQNQRRLTTEFNKCVLQRTNFKTKLTLRDPYEEFFNLLCQCVKLNSECFGDVYYINTEKYYQECKKTGGPFNHWEDWIKKKFQDHIAQHTSV